MTNKDSSQINDEKDEMDTTSVSQLEEIMANKDYTEAARLFSTILRSMRRGNHFSTHIITNQEDYNIISIYTRLAKCFSDMFLDDIVMMTVENFNHWMVYAREIHSIFAVSGFYRTDFIIALFLERLKKSINNHSEKNQSMKEVEKYVMRILLFYSLDNMIDFDIKMFQRNFPYLTSVAFISLLSTQIVQTKIAHERREKLLSQVEIIKDFSMSININMMELSISWMMVSYLSSRHRHKIKKYFNDVIRRWVVAEKIDLYFQALTYQPKKKRPKMLIILEYFSHMHAMGRSYYATLKALSKNFYLIAFSLAGVEGENSFYEIFDEFIVMKDDQENTSGNGDDYRPPLKEIAKIKPDVIFYPGLGMQAVSVIMANIRVAPIQIMAFGHPASSFSPYIDYAVCEEDYAPESDDLFTEKLITVPAESMPLMPMDFYKDVELPAKKTRDVIYIAISGASFKVSYPLLEACQSIAKQAKRTVKFLFYINQVELSYLECKRHILNMIPNAHVYYRLPLDQFINDLKLCDLYLSTFPFCGANSVVDAMCMGLPVVCLRGEDVSERTGSALLSRRRLPNWLITHSVEEYVQAALRLIHNDEERWALRELVFERSRELFSELNPNYMGQTDAAAEALWQIYQKHQQLQKSPHRRFTLANLKKIK